MITIKNSIINSSVTQHLDSVSDLDENCFLDLSLIYTLPDIPVTRKDIPSQEDVDQWPHPHGIQLLVINARIGTLVANDVPKAIDPIDVGNSGNGGPYATKTLLGGAINGPWSRQDKGQGIGSFFVNADLKSSGDGCYDVKTEMS